MHQNVLQKFYTDVVQRLNVCVCLSFLVSQVEEFRARDAENGLKIAQVLEGFISRKVVKQTVMTVVYGVTRYGGRLQIEKRLKEIDEFPKVWVEGGKGEWCRGFPSLPLHTVLFLVWYQSGMTEGPFSAGFPLYGSLKTNFSVSTFSLSGTSLYIFSISHTLIPRGAFYSPIVFRMHMQALITAVTAAACIFSMRDCTPKGISVSVTLMLRVVHRLLLLLRWWRQKAFKHCYSS